MDVFSEYEQLFEDAELLDDPTAMAKIAALYQMGVLPTEYGDEHIFWLKKFFETPEVYNVIEAISGNDKNKVDDETFEMLSQLKNVAVQNGVDDRDVKIIRPHEILIGMEEEELDILYNTVFDGGISLGLYYRFSCNIDELNYALARLYDVLDITKGDYIEIEDRGKVSISIYDLIGEIQTRIICLKEEGAD